MIMLIFWIVVAYVGLSLAVAALQVVSILVVELFKGVKMAISRKMR